MTYRRAQGRFVRFSRKKLLSAPSTRQISSIEERRIAGGNLAFELERYWPAADGEALASRQAVHDEVLDTAVPG